MKFESIIGHCQGRLEEGSNCSKVVNHLQHIQDEKETPHFQGNKLSRISIAPPTLLLLHRKEEM